jgi:hypothetical protein
MTRSTILAFEDLKTCRGLSRLAQNEPLSAIWDPSKLFPENRSGLAEIMASFALVCKPRSYPDSAGFVHNRCQIATDLTKKGGISQASYDAGPVPSDRDALYSLTGVL